MDNEKENNELWESGEYEETSLAWETKPTNWEGVLRTDHSEWNGIKKEMKIVQEAVKASELGETLVKESWLGLFVPDGQLREGEQPEVDYLKPLFQKAMEMPEWQLLRKTTCLDGAVAGYGTASFITEFGKNLPAELKQELAEAKKRADEAKQAAQELEELQEQQNFQNEKGNQEAAQKLQQKIKSAGKKADQARQNLDNQKQKLRQTMQDNSGQVEQAISKSSQAAQGEVSDMQEAMDQMKDFGTAPGRESKRKIEGLEKLADFFRKNKNLRLIMDTLGWARQVIQAEMRKSVYGKDTLVDIRGKELDMDTLQPEELVGLMAEEGSPIWIDTMVRLGSDELLHRKYEGEEKVGRGPLVVVHDKSGSMTGGPNAIASAILLALILEMHKQNRRVISIPFSSAGQSLVFEAVPGKTTLDEVLAHIEFGWWGGTEPYGPLEKAIEILTTDENMKQGDILILTDGAFIKASDSFLEGLQKAREKPGLRLTAVVIDTSPGEASFADKVILVKDLLEEKEKLADAISSVL
jgi:uncharacterized protein with von Willebrand factor type A (vWA) domain